MIEAILKWRDEHGVVHDVVDSIGWNYSYPRGRARKSTMLLKMACGVRLDGPGPIKHMKFPDGSSAPIVRWPSGQRRAQFRPTTCLACIAAERE